MNDFVQGSFLRFFNIFLLFVSWAWPDILCSLFNQIWQISRQFRCFQNFNPKNCLCLKKDPRSWAISNMTVKVKWQKILMLLRNFWEISGFQKRPNFFRSRCLFLYLPSRFNIHRYKTPPTSSHFALCCLKIKHLKWSRQKSSRNHCKKTPF